MSGFVEVKTADLVGAALDWAVAQVEEVKTIMLSPRFKEPKKPFALFGSMAMPIGDGEQGYAPSTCWHCGGPLIDKYQMDLTFERNGLIYSYRCNDDDLPMIDSQDRFGSFGPTHLIAVCREIVASVLGETVSVPKELLS